MKYYMQLFGYYVKFAKERSWWIYVLLVAFLCANIVIMLEPLVLGELINTLQKQDEAMRSDVVLYLLLLVLIPFGQWVFHGTARVVEEKLSFYCVQNLKESIFQKLCTLPMGRHNDHHTGDSLDRLQKASTALDDFSGNHFMIIGTVCGFFLSIFMLMRIWFVGGLLFLIAGLSIFVFVGYIDRILVMLQKKINTKEHKLSSLLYDYISNIKTIITLRCTDTVQSSIHSSILGIFPFFKKYAVINEWKWFGVSMFIALLTALFLGGYIWNVIQADDVLLLGTVTMIFGYIQRMSSSFYHFARLYSQLVQQATNLATIDDIANAQLDENVISSQYDHTSRGCISIQHVYFAYGEKVIFDGFAFSMRRSEKIAIIGSSGSGKSTFLALLRGLYDMQADVLIDDREAYMQDVHAMSALIPQDPEIFENTLRYNITLGTGVSAQKLQNAVQQARVDEFVDLLPAGLDTDIKEKGVNLSGGQKQRLALARGLCLAHDAPILLLDEATSSIDAQNEQKIYQSLFTHHKQKTIIATVHRLHMLHLFDTVYHMEAGKIIAFGTWQDILATSHPTRQLREAYQMEIQKD